MKKFSFSLQRLLGYKEQLFESERNVLAEMNAHLFQLQDEKEKLQNSLTSGAEDLRAKYAQGTTALEISQHKIYLDSLTNAILQKDREIRFQQQAIDRQTDKVREAKIEISTMEKLREKKLEEYNYQAGKAQDQFVEEFISTQKAMSSQT